MVGIGIDYGINMSPILASAAVKWLQQRCQEFASSRVIHIVAERGAAKRKRAARRAKREMNAQANGSTGRSVEVDSQKSREPTDGQPAYEPSDEMLKLD